MAREPDSLAVRFAAVLALAVIILVVMTLAAPPYPANDTAAQPIERRDLPGSIFEFVLVASARTFLLVAAIGKHVEVVAA